MMADATRSIFNKKATEKLRSPEDLDKYVQVTNPSVWIALIACVILLLSLLSWGLLGAVTTDVSATGAVIATNPNDSSSVKPMCFLTSDEAEEVSVGDKAVVGGVDMTVSEVKQVPMSAGEVRGLLNSDYLTNALINGDWAYAVVFDGDTSGLAQNVPISVSIEVERIAPISLILKNWG